MEKLLVFGDDGSGGADTAWGWICSQDWSGWRVHVVAVRPVDADHSDSHAPQIESPDAPRTAPLECHFAGIEHIVAYGKPQEVLAGIAADLMVVGPRGTGLRKKVRLGSVAEALIQAPCAPVIVARQSCKVEDVVLAVDGSSHAQAATELLGEMPWAKQAKVTVISVDEGNGQGARSARDAATYLEGKVGSVQSVVTIPSDMDITFNVRYSLDEYIDKNPCQLVVMGTQGLRGVNRLRVGSVASHVAHHVDSSVFLVRDTTTSQ